ncbi:hypothetical protein QM787_23260 [Rhodococcus ruber]|uniref:hypothetical protein n=1 Tax=Rhodococcus TaxID=1827 RepID=UPI000299F672|nr:MULTISPECIES: hypothetical protein [Rhodococcus]MCD2129417.1 hypothetical protein [Rhodococcus ruber]MCF8786487.1 hypothetical protein [Rhodococcus ruber]MCZ1071482.1 hypothetical protein [Rhodococcus sp. A5(2022)]MCZ4505839.1 hypothetical protein [Rhodococcus ruber]MCZ4533049.1 hypothetical protein [Rhodococcus ruber]
MIYPLVRELAAGGIPVAVTCRVLGIARQPYYRWLVRPVTDAELEEAYRANALFDAHREDPEFGYRFLADEARDAGESMSDRTAWRICSENRWWSAFGKKRGSKKGCSGPPVHDDLVGRVFASNEPNRLWLTDITEHRTDEGKLYLLIAVVASTGSRKSRAVYRAEIGLGVSGRRIPASRCGPRGRHLGRERGFSTVRGQVVGIGAVALEPGPGGVMIEVIGNGLTGGLEDVAVTVADGVVLLDAECRERGLAATCAFVDYYSEDLSDPIAHLYSGANAGFFLDLFGQIHVGDESVVSPRSALENALGGHRPRRPSVGECHPRAVADSPSSGCGHAGAPVIPVIRFRIGSGCRRAGVDRGLGGIELVLLGSVRPVHARLETDLAKL